MPTIVNSRYVCIPVQTMLDTCVVSGRLRLNMGNIYFEQGNYTQAMKMYRMALDKFSASHQMMRLGRTDDELVQLLLLIVIWVSVFWRRCSWRVFSSVVMTHLCAFVCVCLCVCMHTCVRLCVCVHSCVYMYHVCCRMKVLQNIATVLIKTGRYADAVNHLEVIMTEGASFKSGMSRRK